MPMDHGTGSLRQEEKVAKDAHSSIMSAPRAGPAPIQSEKNGDPIMTDRPRKKGRKRTLSHAHTVSVKHCSFPMHNPNTHATHLNGFSS